MRKLLLIFGAALALSTTAFFNACSTDEVDAEQLSKKQLLLAKSKEFARKYGVNMTLREDRIDEIAQRLTVEQMERDFKEMVELKESAKLPVCKIVNRKNALKFRSTITPGEETEEDEQREKVYTGKLTASSEHTSNRELRVDAELTWTFSQTKNRSAHLYGGLFEDGSEIGSAIKTIDTENFSFTDSLGVSFDLDCESTIRTEDYEITYSVEATCKNNTGSMTIKF